MRAMYCWAASRLPDAAIAARKDIAEWRAREETVSNPFEGIDFQGDYMHGSAGPSTDYPPMNVRQMGAAIQGVGASQRQEGIVTYRDRSYPSTSDRHHGAGASHQVDAGAGRFARSVSRLRAAIAMLITGIKSKPVYEPLQADIGGRYHLMLGLGDGPSALLRVAQELQSQVPAALNNALVLIGPRTPSAAAAASGSQASEEERPFKDLGLANVHSYHTTAALLEGFRAALELALMGTRLYVAGPESFLGLAMKSALEYNLNKDEIRAEEMGSLARRVYCIHCRTTAEDVTTNIVQCPGCGRWLLVRDHYSRRIAAYMGVMVDAEAPGELPEIKQVFV